MSSVKYLAVGISTETVVGRRLEAKSDLLCIDHLQQFTKRQHIRLVEIQSIFRRHNKFEIKEFIFVFGIVESVVGKKGENAFSPFSPQCFQKALILKDFKTRDSGVKV